MKFIIFDIDGTLTDTKKADDKCFIAAFYKTFKINLLNVEWHTLKNVTDWGITEEIIEQQLKRQPTQNEYDLMKLNFFNLLKKEKEKDPAQFKEVKGAKDFFYKLLNENGYQLGIATGSWEKSAKIKLNSIGVGLEGICFSNSDHHKSRGAITNDVINQLEKKNEQKANQIIYFGDGQWDFETCKNLNLQFIGIDVLKDGKLKAIGAETVFTNYLNSNEIISAIEKV